MRLLAAVLILLFILLMLVGWIVEAAYFIRNERRLREQDPERRKRFFPWDRVIFMCGLLGWLGLLFRLRDLLGRKSEDR